MLLCHSCCTQSVLCSVWGSKNAPTEATGFTADGLSTELMIFADSFLTEGLRGGWKRKREKHVKNHLLTFKKDQILQRRAHIFLVMVTKQFQTFALMFSQYFVQILILQFCHKHRTVTTLKQNVNEQETKSFLKFEFVLCPLNVSVP